jgi:hypothetical protein
MHLTALRSKLNTERAVQSNRNEGCDAHVTSEKSKELLSVAEKTVQKRTSHKEKKKLGSTGNTKQGRQDLLKF